MAKTASAGFRKNEKVTATEDLLGVPRGTKGKVKLVNGVTWRRYWVFFDNGVQSGSIDGSKLVRTDDWDAYRLNQIAEAVESERGDPTPEVAPSAEPSDDAAGGSKIPAHLLERSKKAKAAKSGENAEDSASTSEAASKVPAHLLERAAAAKAKKAAGQT